jgi:glycosyltransferase involved in cell wall biosynthesis
MPLVSVVIPTYKRPALLAEAVRSIFLQTFEDFELIVVDDGSGAETRALLDGVSDPRLRVLYLDHGERSQARNTGMREARGKYIALLDDDDLSLPYRLAKQVEFLEAHPDLDVAGCGGHLVSESGTVFSTIRPWEKEREPTLTNCLMGCFFLPSGVMLRRDALDGIEPWFDPDLRLAEDFDFWIRLAHAGRRMAWVREALIVYRLYEGRSAALHIGYMMNCKRVLEAYFARPDVPPEALQARGAAYAQCALNGAFRAYAGEAANLGERFLREAVAYEPDFLEPPEFPRLLAAFVSFVTRQVFSDRAIVVETFFQGLPRERAGLAGFRDRVWDLIREQEAEMGGSQDAAVLTDFEEKPESGTKYSYFCYGLRIQSEWRFPGVPECAFAGGDVEIQRGELKDFFPREPATLTQKVSEGETHLAFQGRGLFVVLDGREILFDTPLPDGNMDFSIVLSEMVLPVLLYQRGLSIFHAVSVAVSSREAFAFLGPPRAGKTALACALHARGATVLDDDLLVFDSTGAPLRALRGFPVIKTQYDPASFSMCAGERVMLGASRWNKALFRTGVPVDDGSSGIPLTALFVVKPQEGPATLQMMKPTAALAELSPRWYGQLYGPLREVLGGLARAFRESCALASHVPVFELGVSRAPDGLADALRVLKEAGFLKSL